MHLMPWEIEKGITGNSLPTLKNAASPFLSLNLSVYNYHSEGKRKPGLKSPSFSNQTRPKASCKLLAAFVKSPPFLQLKKTFHIRLFFKKTFPDGLKYIVSQQVKLEVKLCILRSKYELENFSMRSFIKRYEQDPWHS